MDCPICGCQETKFITGISKTGKNIGQPWSAYDCTNPSCKNEKGFQTRTFVRTQPNQAKFAPKKPQVGNLGPTIEDIMKELKKMQDFMGMLPPKDIESVNKEMQLESEENQVPF